VLPTFDPATATHVVTETSQKMTLRALELKSLSEIPLEIPTVKWGWVISGKPIPGEKDKREMDYEFLHAAFSSRMDAGCSFTGKITGKKGGGKQNAGDDANQAGARQESDGAAYVAFSVTRCVVYTHWMTKKVRELSLRRHARLRAASGGRRLVSYRRTCPKRGVEEETPRCGPPCRFYPGLTDGEHWQVAGPSRRRSRSPSSEGSPPSKTRKKLKVSARPALGNIDLPLYDLLKGVYLRRSRLDGGSQYYILHQSGYC
jgi:hypothetical protein